jgi:hypothetical protein
MFLPWILVFTAVITALIGVAVTTKRGADEPL